MRIAVLDDYLRLSRRLVNWSAVDARADVTVFDRHLREDEAVQALAPFDAVCHLRERMAMPRGLIERLPRLKFIAITGPSHRTLDLQAAHERGIVVSCTLNIGAGSVATPELAWGLILSLARHIPQSAAAMRLGGWQREYGTVLHGKTLGLIGLGRIGRAMVPIARAFGMQVLAWSTNLGAGQAAEAGAQYCSRDDLLARSDFVSLHLVASERSRHTLGAREIARMKPGAFVVNTARASLVDTDALIDALRQRRIAGAALDVFDEEPLPDGHPLRQLDNCILTPHLGYTVEESLRTFYAGTVENLLAFIDGRPIHQLFPAASTDAQASSGQP